MLALLAATAFLRAKALRSLPPPPRLDNESGGQGRPQDRWSGDENKELMELQVGIKHARGGSLRDDDDEDTVTLPALDAFNRTWSSMTTAADNVLIVPGIRLVMGIFTTRREASYRSVIRDTWMTKPGVCKAPQGPTATCSVYVAFVQGNGLWSSLESSTEVVQGDMIFLPTRENMDRGKTLEYFRLALVLYPWATHLGKMDSDVFPKWSVIVDSLGKTRPGCESYVGRPWSCHDKEYCPPKRCGPPTRGRFRVYDAANRGTCWTYMQGGLYIVSRTLLSLATELLGHWERYPNGPEDARAGQAIFVATKRHNLCVGTWPQALAQSNVTYFHFRQGSEGKDDCPCISPEWATYYHRAYIEPNWTKVMMQG
mmetsp:Transcript_63529/g.148137  ORF Transcript_63529/g.148137 Transcript_63529/m.148137 type:complete len:370 (+) Transcript_63529:63-1172(+)